MTDQDKRQMALDALRNGEFHAGEHHMTLVEALTPPPQSAEVAVDYVEDVSKIVMQHASDMIDMETVRTIAHEVAALRAQQSVPQEVVDKLQAELKKAEQGKKEAYDKEEFSRNCGKITAYKLCLALLTKNKE